MINPNLRQNLVSLKFKGLFQGKNNNFTGQTVQESSQLSSQLHGSTLHSLAGEEKKKQKKRKSSTELPIVPNQSQRWHLLLLHSLIALFLLVNLMAYPTPRLFIIVVTIPLCLFPSHKNRIIHHPSKFNLYKVNA